MGSVKDLAVFIEPTVGNMGRGQFIFSDRYSVFDWGEMPDHLLNKGKALCILSAYFFEKLFEMGIKTHYLGLIEDSKLKSLSELNGPVNVMEITLLRVIKPGMDNGEYQYSAYQKDATNFLIPFEIIYRNALPEGSSVFKRLKEGSLKLRDIGLDKMPSPNDLLNQPILELSTKLESTDRYLSWGEARNLVELTDNEIEEIKRTTLIINELITKEVNRIGLVNEDGKVEFGFDGLRNLMLIDVLGTPDECRFTYKEMPVSKEIARIFYRNTRWYEEIEKAKIKDRTRWKEYVNSSPPPLPTQLYRLISLLYQVCCNEITQRRWFVTPSLKEILAELHSILNFCKSSGISSFPSSCPVSSFPS